MYSTKYLLLPIIILGTKDITTNKTDKATICRAVPVAKMKEVRIEIVRNG